MPKQQQLAGKSCKPLVDDPTELDNLRNKALASINKLTSYTGHIREKEKKCIGEAEREPLDEALAIQVVREHNTRTTVFDRTISKAIRRQQIREAQQEESRIEGFAEDKPHHSLPHKRKIHSQGQHQLRYRRQRMN